MAAGKVNWPEAMLPLIKKYRHKRHPLEYTNTYQLLVMVVLSAQATDSVINLVAPKFFSAYPDMEALSGATAPELFPYIANVRNFGHKAAWLVSIAQQIKTDKSIPLTLEELVKLPGI